MNTPLAPAQAAQNDTDDRIAIVGLGACLPDAPDVATFWRNVLAGHVAIGEVPPERWSQAVYFDGDRSIMDRTYSRIGGFIRYEPGDTRRFRLVPRSLPAIDDVQKFALVAVAEALGQAGLKVFAKDEGGIAFNRERCATIFGNTMGGEAEDRTSLRVWLLEVEDELRQSARAAGRSAKEADDIVAQFHASYAPKLPRLTEDSMPGEISNCITGRIANVFDLCGANFTTDAACASTMAAVQAGVNGLLGHEFDTAVVGGADRSMDPPTFVKFCRIGALSPDRSTPFDAGANGFVMGEGVGVLVLKRYRDAVADGHQVLAVIRGIGASSDGRGKGMTAPNPRGQRLAVERAWQDAGCNLRDVGLFEAHGTSTAVGDACEVQVLTELLEEAGHDGAPVPLGSVKSMIGHLKSASGAASLIKATLALRDGVLPPSAGFRRAAPGSPLHRGRLAVQTASAPWTPGAGPRLVGVSSFGFGGTNFHVVLEEAPGRADAEAQARGTNGARANGNSPAGLAAAPAAPAAAASAVAATAATAASLADEVTAVFAEHTGYDVAELAPTHHLEGDLGVDSVKQAEILALLRERYRIATDVPAALAELNSLAAVIDFVGAHRDDAGPGASAAQRQAPSAAPAAPSPQAAKTVRVANGAANVNPGQHAVQAADAPSAGASAAGAAGAPTSAAAPAPAGDAPGGHASSDDGYGARFDGTEVLAFGGADFASLYANARAALAQARGPAGWAPLRRARAEAHRAPVRLAFVAADLAAADRAVNDAETKGLKGARLLAAKGTFLAEGTPLAARGSAAFLFPGQGSQYLGMLQDLAARYPVVADTFAEADRVLQPLLGSELTPIVWAAGRSEDDELALRRTEVCQPAMLTADVAMARLLAQYGLRPSVVAGHSLGEYAAAVVAGVLSFADALYAVSARGREMAGVKVDDPGRMAMVAADAGKVEAVLAGLSGYVIAANKNCHTQTVIAGASPAVEAALVAFAAQGIEARPIAVSHAFHSAIVAPAAEPLQRVLAGLDVRPPQVPLSSNVDAAFYPERPADIVARMARQLAAPVQFIDQIEGLWAHGARVFVEVGPKRAITGFVRNILADREHRALATNHPKKPGVQGVLETLAALTVDGLEVGYDASAAATPAEGETPAPAASAPAPAAVAPMASANSDVASAAPAPHRAPNEVRVVITGTSVLLPGQDRVPDWREDPYASLLAGTNFIGDVPEAVRRDIAAKNVVRLEKASGRFVPLESHDDVMRHAATMGPFDLRDWGIDPALAQAMDATGQLTVAAGIDALRDAGLPLVPHLRTTSTGSKLHDRWGLPPRVAERTGVILGSAFPSLDAVLAEAGRAGEGTFDRKWLFRALPMGHAQLAQAVLAQGPNTQLNAACASGTQALAMAADWIRLGRCDRVVVVTADDITKPGSMGWVGAGFLAAGAASVEPDLARAAVPFGAERNGLILGSGAAAFVVEDEGAARARGIEPVAELVAGEFINSAFHGTRLDTPSIARFLEGLVARVDADGRPEARCALARRCIFLSHETYTPARGGSAAAEVDGLRHVFGAGVTELVIANTKGYTGHPMGASFEDVVAIKGLQRQVLPPIANFHAPDPSFADLRFADGGPIDADVALRFAAGFGSQVAACAYRRRARQEARLQDAAAFARWCADNDVPMERGFEVHCRTLRVAVRDGRALWDLGVPSLARPESDADAGVAASPLVAAVASTPAPAIAVAASAASAAQATDVPAVPDEATLLAELTALFAEATGYDAAELAPDHALEADLGIDSVKQAEILAQVRTQYGVAAEASMSSQEVETLAGMASWLRGQLAAGAPATASPTGAPQQAQTPAASPDSRPQRAPEAQPASASSSPGASPNEAQLVRELTEMFAEQTGYDVAELAPDHALEADLGIDSVKQAEILALVRTRYGVATEVPVQLAEVDTLVALAQWLVRSLAASPANPATAPTSTPTPNATVAAQNVAANAAPVQPAQPSALERPPSAQPAPAADGAAISHATLVAELTALFAEQTGYEPADLEPEHALEADLGIDSVKQAEILALVRQRYGIPTEAPLQLADVPNLVRLAEWVRASLPAGAEPKAPAAVASASAPTPPATPVSPQASAAPTPAAAAPPAGATAPASPKEILAELTALFARETGYDEADLAPDHALEADLGIDSVKQAELFAQVRSTYGLGTDPDFRLAEVQTLAAMAAYVAGRRDNVVGAADGAAPNGTTPCSAPAQARVGAPVVVAHGDISARAVDLLPLPAPPAAASLAGLGTCEVLGIDAAAVAEVVAGLAERGLRAHARVLDVASAAAAALPAAVDTAVWVVTPGVGAACFARARAWAQAQRRPQRMVAVCRNGAGFGLLRGADVEAPDHAQVLALAETSALLKALDKEWPETRCLSVDVVEAQVSLGRTTSWRQAARVAADAWAAPERAWPVLEAVATCRADGTRWLSPARRPNAVTARSVPLARGARVVATGGARGITYALLHALARRRPLDLVILARTPGVRAEHSVLHGHDEAGQRQLAKAALQREGRRDTPAAVRSWIAAQQVKVEVESNLEALRQLGCTVRLIACDVASPAARERALHELHKLHDGRHTALLLHGAGYEESRRIEDKDADAWRRTAAPKGEAFAALVAALRPARTVTMGSIAGRFGNGAQTDYAAANEALAAHARLHPQGALNLGWTAWSGIGMAERGSVRRVLEAGGVVMMPGEVGVALGAELIESDVTGDVVVAGPLGQMAAAERRVPALFDDVLALTDGDGATDHASSGFCLRRTFDPARDGGLDHHRIANVPVLPGVLGVELMVQAASWALGSQIDYLRQVRFASPIKFFRDAPLAVDVDVRRTAEGCELQVHTTFVGPDGTQRRRVHFTGVGLVTPPPAPDHAQPSLHALGTTRTLAPLSRADIYRRYFHGPSFQVLADAPRLGDAGADAQGAAPTAAWLRNVDNGAFVSHPWLREAGFQAAGLHEMAESGRMSLPAGIDELWLLPVPGAPAQPAQPAQPKSSGNFRVAARYRDSDAKSACYDVALHDGQACIGLMRGLRTVVLRQLEASERFVGTASAPALGAERPERVVLPLAEAERLLQPDAGAALAFYLSGAERQRLAQLRLPKRRIDWLAGRLAAKVALRRSWRPADRRPAWSALTVAADGHGEPELLLAATERGSAGAMPRLSISHGDGWAVAAVSWDADVSYGVDVERVAPRDPAFAETYFTAAERAWASAATEPNVAYTILWAVKEAALKALGLAGQVDLRQLEVQGPARDASATSAPYALQLRDDAQKRAGQRGLVVAAIEVEATAERVLAQVTAQRRRDAARGVGRPQPSHDGEAASI